MIDVIGTDAGAPESLPGELQELIRRAETVAAPIRQHQSLAQWLDRPQETLIATDDPQALCDVLKRESSAVVLASGDPLWFGIGRILQGRLGSDKLRFHPSPTSLQLIFEKYSLLQLQSSNTTLRFQLSADARIANCSAHLLIYSLTVKEVVAIG